MKPHRRVWEAASLVLSILLSLTTKQSLALGWTATLLIWSCHGIKCHFSNILSFSCVYLVWERSIFHLEIKPLLGQLASRVKPLDYCKQIFLTLNAVKDPIQEKQKSLRKPLLSNLGSVHTHRYPPTIIIQEITWFLYLVKVFVKVICMGKLAGIISPLSSQGLDCPYRYSIQNKNGNFAFLGFFSCLVYTNLKVKQIKPGKGSSNWE